MEVHNFRNFPDSAMFTPAADPAVIVYVLPVLTIWGPLSLISVTEIYISCFSTKLQLWHNNSVQSKSPFLKEDDELQLMSNTETVEIIQDQNFMNNIEV